MQRERLAPGPRLSPAQRALLRALRRVPEMQDEGMTVEAIRALRLVSPRGRVGWFTIAALLEGGYLAVRPESHVVRLTPKGWRLPV